MLHLQHCTSDKEASRYFRNVLRQCDLLNSDIAQAASIEALYHQLLHALYDTAVLPEQMWETFDPQEQARMLQMRDAIAEPLIGAVGEHALLRRPFCMHLSQCQCLSAARSAWGRPAKVARCLAQDLSQLGTQTWCIARC